MLQWFCRSNAWNSSRKQFQWTLLFILSTIQHNWHWHPLITNCSQKPYSALINLANKYIAEIRVHNTCKFVARGAFILSVLREANVIRSNLFFFLCEEENRTITKYIGSSLITCTCKLLHAIQPLPTNNDQTRHPPEISFVAINFHMCCFCRYGAVHCHVDDDKSQRCTQGL